MENEAQQPPKAWILRPFAWAKRLYHWVLHWAETPYGVPALFLLAFAESSFFPIPPDVLLIALTLSIPKKGFYYATICSIGPPGTNWVSAKLMIMIPIIVGMISSSRRRI